MRLFYSLRNVFFCLLAGASLLVAQPIKLSSDKKLKLFTEESTLLKEKSILIRTADTAIAATELNDAFVFPNVGKVRYFQDKKLYPLLQEAIAKDDIGYLTQNLPAYIAKFGADNFSKDVDLLWQAGRIYEVFQDTTKALFFYRLALKHGDKRPEHFVLLDSLQSSTRSQWTSIDEYNKFFDIRKKVDNFITDRHSIKSMGKEINSSEPDYAPYMHPTDSVIIFTSRRGNTNAVDPFSQANEELYYTKIDFLTGKWMTAEKLPGNSINSQYNEGSGCLSPDGLTVYFSRCSDPTGKGDCDIYESTFLPDSNKWTKPKNLGYNVNSAEWDSHPSISKNGKVLFFASSRRGGFGGIDLYYSMRGDDGVWKPAENLGPFVNTTGNEVTPFLHSIELTLYFGSNRQLDNFGGFDLYKTHWEDNRWTEPQNLGPIVNTPGDEYYFTIDGRGNRIFFSRTVSSEGSESGENMDLFELPMPMEARPDANTRLRGVVIDSVTKNRLQGRVMIIDLDNGVEITSKKLNKNGEFEFDLVKNNRYRIYVSGDNFFTIRQDITLKRDSAFKIFTQSIEMNEPVVFDALEFKPASFELRPGSKPKLDYLIQFLRKYPEFNLSIEGHTDSDGNKSDNEALSLKRAQMIAKYLSEAGKIRAARIKSVGYGDARPLVPNDTKENKRKNRRVEFRLYLNKAMLDTMRKQNGGILPTEAELKSDYEPEKDTYDPEKFLREFEDKALQADPEKQETPATPPANTPKTQPAASTDPFKSKVTEKPISDKAPSDDFDLEKETEMWDDLPVENDTTDDMNLEELNEELFDDGDLEKEMEGLNEFDTKGEEIKGGDDLFDTSEDE